MLASSPALPCFLWDHIVFVLVSPSVSLPFSLLFLLFFFVLPVFPFLLSAWKYAMLCSTALSCGGPPKGCVGVAGWQASLEQLLTDISFCLPYEICVCFLPKHRQTRTKPEREREQWDKGKGVTWREARLTIVPFKYLTAFLLKLHKQPYFRWYLRVTHKVYPFPFGKIEENYSENLIDKTQKEL